MNDNSTVITPTNPLANWVTINEAASILRVNPSTARRWLSQGVLRGARIGKSTLRIDLSSLRYETIGGAA